MTTTNITSTCATCVAGQRWCAPGRTWPLPTGPCVACGRETVMSAACGYPHCEDCRQPQPAPTTETALATVGRTYTAAGWKVFPLWWIADDGRCACPNGRRDLADKDYCGVRPDGTVSGSPGKHPITRNGVKDATDDEDQVADWWCRWPHANPGLPAGDNGLAILDVDPRKGGDESLAKLDAYGFTKGVDLAATLSQHTGGDGLHRIYMAPEGGIKNGANVFGPDMPGLDTRGRGGYIVVAPAIHYSGGVYEWVDFFADIAPWPEFLTTLMDPPKPSVPVYTGPVRTGNAEAYAAKALQDEVLAVRMTAEGNRNNRLHLAAFNLGQLVAGGKLPEGTVMQELYTAGVGAGLSPKAALATIRSGLTGGAAKPRARA